MQRRLIAFTATLLLAGCATHPQTSSPAATAPQTEAEPKLPLITKSAVFFPDTTADLELFQKYVYPDAADGVQITYRSKALPDAKIDFFVFALGRAPTDLALKQGMERVRGEIQAANKAGMYEGTVFDREADVSVKQADGSQLPGRKLMLHYDIHGAPYLSAGYMFYKQMYFVEMRVSTPAKLSAEALEQGADEAAAEAVPLIRIVNSGGCADIVVGVTSQDLQSPNGLVAALERATAANATENCPHKQLSADDSKPKDGEHVEFLEYSAADWQ